MELCWEALSIKNSVEIAFEIYLTKGKAASPLNWRAGRIS